MAEKRNWGSHPYNQDFYTVMTSNMRGNKVSVGQSVVWEESRKQHSALKAKQYNSVTL